MGDKVTKSISRNEKCPCGSGLKYKYCCIDKTPERKLKTNKKCECGNPLVIDFTNSLANQLQPSTLGLLNYCKDNGFYFFRSLSLYHVLGLLEKLYAGSLNINDFVLAYKEYNTEENALKILDRFFEYECFEKRKLIILDIINAHFNGKYTLSIPCFFTVIEGILRDYGQLDSKENIKPTIESDIGDKRLLFTLSDAIKFFNSYISNLFKGSQGNQVFNRNSILHGTNCSYGTEQNSLFLLLTLLEIGAILSIKKLPELIKI